MKRKKMENFTKILKKRIEIEEKYANSIENLSNLFTDFLEKGFFYRKTNILFYF